MERPFVSIIVPIYKVEPYLRRCVDSILAQTYPDFELILVDDGSPDGAPAICDAYAAQDRRVRVIHQANAGVSAARNAGLDVMQGAFFTFVDGDDALEPEALERLLAAAAETGGSLIGSAGDCPTAPAIPQDEAIRKFLLLDEGIGGSACGRLYRTSTYGDLRFDPRFAVAEDRLFLFQALTRCGEYHRCGGAIYRVIGHPDSATRGAYSHRQGDMISVAELVRQSVLLQWGEDKALSDCANYHVAIVELDFINALLRGGCWRQDEPQLWAMVVQDLKAADLSRWSFAERHSLSRLRLFSLSPDLYRLVYAVYRRLKHREE